MDTNSVVVTDPGMSIPGLNRLPHSWQGPVLIGAFVLPYLTRAWSAFKGGGGASGIKNAILFGSINPPHLATPPTSTTPKAP